MPLTHHHTPVRSLSLIPPDSAPVDLRDYNCHNQSQVTALYECLPRSAHLMPRYSFPMVPLVTGTVARLVSLVDQVCKLLFFSLLDYILIKHKKSLKALFLNFQTFLQGTHIEPVGTHCEPPSLSRWLSSLTFLLAIVENSTVYATTQYFLVPHKYLLP